MLLVFIFRSTIKKMERYVPKSSKECESSPMIIVSCVRNPIS